LVIMDYVFGNEMEHRHIYVNYEGRNPFELYSEIENSFDDIFAVPAGRVHETNYNVDNKKDKIVFGAGWTVIKQMDVYSYLRYDIGLKGEQGNETKIGKANISLKVKIYTEYPQDNIIQQNIFYEMARRIWHETIYENTRDKYILEGREISNNFTSYLKTCFLKLNQN
ncbi:MAG: hypothetical protein KAI55_02935, partial [Candidatus Aenigmarchaeota archaeon]|nr:hypothetical protein [Candidatus Aenigmarchaeota archaeon]